MNFGKKSVLVIFAICSFLVIGLGFASADIDTQASAIDETNIQLEAGWNMFSVPSETTAENVFGELPEFPTIYGWEQGYQPVNSEDYLSPDKGYWVYMEKDTSISLPVPEENRYEDLLDNYNALESEFENLKERQEKMKDSLELLSIKTGEAGDTFTVDDWHVKVSKEIYYENKFAENNDGWYDIYSAHSEYKVALVRLKITNQGTSTRSEYLSSERVFTEENYEFTRKLGIDLQDEGTLYEGTPDENIYNPLDLYEIAPTETREGEIYFEILENSKIKMITFEFAGKDFVIDF